MQLYHVPRAAHAAFLLRAFFRVRCTGLLGCLLSAARGSVHGSLAASLRLAHVNAWFDLVHHWLTSSVTRSIWICCQLQLLQIDACVLAAIGLRTAHLHTGLQAATDSGPRGLAEDAASQGLVQLNAGHAGRFALRHARNGRADGRRDAAGSATGAAIHGETQEGVRQEASGRWAWCCRWPMIESISALPPFFRQ